MSRGSVVVEIDREGNVTVTVTGVPGPACKTASRELEGALGATVKDTPTAEYYRTAATTARLTTS